MSSFKLDQSRSKHSRAAGWVIAALLATGSAAQAYDSDSKFRYLEGNYGFTTSNNCVRAIPHPPSIVGIDPNTRQLLVPGEAIAQSGLGVMHFFKNGTMTLEATASEVNLDKIAAGDFPSTPGLDGTCRGTYTLAAGNKVTLLFNCHIDIPSTGVSFDLGPTEAVGFMGDRSRSMNLSQKENIQTVTLFLPNGAMLKSERVCVQRFALNKLF